MLSKPTSKTVYFKGADGYNNGVDIMHDICKTLYSNPTKGIEARSINLTDMERHLTDGENGGKQARANYGNDAQYGHVKTPPYTEGYSYYPNIYAAENGSGIGTTTPKTDGITDEEKVGI